MSLGVLIWDGVLKAGALLGNALRYTCAGVKAVRGDRSSETEMCLEQWSLLTSHETLEVGRLFRGKTEPLFPARMAPWM